jgi:hypothetical protein
MPADPDAKVYGATRRVGSWHSHISPASHHSIGARAGGVHKKNRTRNRFFLTLIFTKSIPSLAATIVLQLQSLIDRENRQMATKKAAKKTAKKAAAKKK